MDQGVKPMSHLKKKKKKKKPNPKTNQFAAIQIKAISCGFSTGDSWGFFLTRLPGN
jgi:hypothetical protein